MNCKFEMVCTDDGGFKGLQQICVLPQIEGRFGFKKTN